MNKDLQELCHALVDIKAKEEGAKADRVAIEQMIDEMVGGKDEGTVRADAGQFSVAVVRKLNRKLDEAEWEEIAGMVPIGLEPIRMKIELDTKKYKAIESANPALFALVSRAVTVTPAKTSVKVEFMKEAA